MPVKCVECGQEPILAYSGLCLQCVFESPIALLGYSIMNPHALMPPFSNLKLSIRPNKKDTKNVDYILVGFLVCKTGNLVVTKTAEKAAVAYMLGNWMASMVNDLQVKMRAHLDKCGKCKKENGKCARNVMGSSRIGTGTM